MASSTHKVAQKLSVHKNLSFLQPHFTAPTFRTFTGVVRSMLKREKNGSLSQLSSDVGKCISAIGYFFSTARWNPGDVKRAVQEQMLQNPRTHAVEGDVASVDGSSIAKKGDTFALLGEVWDNADKCVKSGYEFMAIALVSPTRKLRWLFDFICFSNKDPEFRGVPVYVLRLLQRLFAVAAQVSMIVFDAGFRNKYILGFVRKQGKNFIIRTTADMILWEDGFVGKKGHGHEFGRIKDMPGAHHHDLEVNGIKGWSVTWATGIVNAWRSEIKTPLTVVIVKNPAFRNPLILVTSLTPITMEEAFNVYQTYLLRWKIERIFQTIKELGLEAFRVRSWQAIIKYLTILFIVHNLLTWVVAALRTAVKLRAVFEAFLKRTRKIPTLLIGGLKIFYQYYLQKSVSLNELFSSDLKGNYVSSK
jgi:hypothetical protein